MSIAWEKLICIPYFSLSSTPVLKCAWVLHLQNIETRLKICLPEDLGSALMDGVVLCHLVNHVRPRSVGSIHVPSPAVVSRMFLVAFGWGKKCLKKLLVYCRMIFGYVKQVAVQLIFFAIKGNIDIIINAFQCTCW